MNLNLEEESYETVISELQEKIAFESLLTEPNTGVITLYRSQIEHYQKLEKKKTSKSSFACKVRKCIYTIERRCNTNEKHYKK